MKTLNKTLATLTILIICLLMGTFTACNQTPPPEKAVLTSESFVQMSSDNFVDANFTFDFKSDGVDALTGNEITLEDWAVDGETLSIKVSFVQTLTQEGEYTFILTTKNGAEFTLKIIINQPIVTPVPQEPSVEGSTDNKDAVGPWIDA